MTVITRVHSVVEERRLCCANRCDRHTGRLHSRHCTRAGQPQSASLENSGLCSAHPGLVIDVVVCKYIHSLNPAAHLCRSGCIDAAQAAVQEHARVPRGVLAQRLVRCAAKLAVLVQRAAPRTYSTILEGKIEDFSVSECRRIAARAVSQVRGSCQPAREQDIIACSSAGGPKQLQAHQIHMQKNSHAKRKLPRVVAFARAGTVP